MTKLTDDAREFLHLTAKAALLERERDAFADRIGDAEMLKVVYEAAFIMGKSTEAGAALYLPDLTDSARRLGLLSPVASVSMSIAAGSSIAAH